MISPISFTIVYFKFDRSMHTHCTLEQKNFAKLSNVAMAEYEKINELSDEDQCACCQSNIMLSIKYYVVNQILCCQSNILLPIKYYFVNQILCCQSNIMLPIKYFVINQILFCQSNIVLAQQELNIRACTKSQKFAI